ncbi:MAG: 50S ribosomal protein L23 [Hydrogenophilus sp.]|nr:50S ribosomal protein L23 [Hydrogenophilus sp.]
MSALRERHFQVLVAPVISEKATMVGERDNTVVFRVSPDSTKPEIKAAVEEIFKVRVKSVNVVTQKGKFKRFGRVVGRRSDVRKAYVTLEPGEVLDLFQGGGA